MQINELNQYFPGKVNVKNGESFNGNNCTLLSVEIKPADKALELDIYIDRRFPEEPPRIFAKRKV